MFFSAKFIRNAILLAVAKVILRYNPDNKLLESLVKSKNYDGIQHYLLSKEGKRELAELRERIPDFDEKVAKEISNFYVIGILIVGKILNQILSGIVVGVIISIVLQLIESRVENKLKLNRIGECISHGIGEGIVEGLYSTAIVYSYEKDVDPLLKELGLEEIGRRVKREVIIRANLINTLFVMSGKRFLLTKKYESGYIKAELENRLAKDLEKSLKSAAKRLNLSEDELQTINDYLSSLNDKVVNDQVLEITEKFKKLLNKMIEKDSKLKEKMDEIEKKYSDKEKAIDKEYTKRIFVLIALTLFYVALDVIMPKLLDKVTKNETSPFVKAVLHGLYPLVKSTLTHCILK